MRVGITVDGAEAAARDFAAIGDRLSKAAEPLLSAAAALMQGWIQEHIRAEQGPDGPWPELHPVTQKIRRHYKWPAASPKLIRAGDLLHSLTTLSQTDTAVEVGTRLHYARILQDGGTFTDPKGNTREVQAFPFVYLTETEVDDLLHSVVAYYFEGPSA